MFFGLLALTFVALLVAGAVAGIVALARVRTLESRMRDLERRRPIGHRPPAAATPPPLPPSAPTLERPHPESDRKSPEIDWESLIAGRWLNRVGVVAVLLATAFFLKLAFDNEWIGPRGRVAIGLVAGAALLAWSQRLLAKGYRYFSEGIAALGAGVLYLSLFAAWDFYELIPQTAAFAGMVVVTAGLATLAWGRDSQRLAVLALLGGLATPGLLSTGVDRQVTLFAYLAILVGGFLAMAWGKRWRWIGPVALIGVLFYLVGWADRFYEPAKLVSTLVFSTLFFVELALPAAASVAARHRLRVDEMLLAVANAGWFGVTLHALLYDEHRWWLTAAVLVVAAAHLVPARAARAAPGADADRPPAARLLYAAIALAFVTAAVPIRLSGDWIPVAWAVEGAALVWAGMRTRVRALRFTGIGLTALAAILLVDSSGVARPLIFNTRFLSFAAVAGSLAAASLWTRRVDDGSGEGEQRSVAALGVAANGVGVWGLSEEAWAFLGRQTWSLEPRLAQQMGLSVLWTALAALLILAGVRAGSKALRWQGLVLVGLTVGKVFLFDLSFLERAYRIVSFFALGLVLLVVSFFYQRSLRGDDEEAP